MAVTRVPRHEAAEPGGEASALALMAEVAPQKPGGPSQMPKARQEGAGVWLGG